MSAADVVSADWTMRSTVIFVASGACAAPAFEVFSVENVSQKFVGTAAAAVHDGDQVVAVAVAQPLLLVGTSAVTGVDVGLVAAGALLLVETVAEPDAGADPVGVHLEGVSGDEASVLLAVIVAVGEVLGAVVVQPRSGL